MSKIIQIEIITENGNSTFFTNISNMTPIMDDMLDKCDFTSFIELYDILCKRNGMQYIYTFQAKHCRHLLINSMTNELSYLINNNLLEVKVFQEFIFYVSNNWYDAIKYMYSLSILDKFKLKIADLLEYKLPERFKTEPIPSAWCTLERRLTIKRNNEFKKDCFNEFVNCIKREYINNPLFDINILKYEIEKYFKN